MYDLIFKMAPGAIEFFEAKPSANTQNCPAAETLEDVESYFLNKLSFIISGAVDSAGSVSEIIDLVTGEVIRNG